MINNHLPLHSLRDTAPLAVAAKVEEEEAMEEIPLITAGMQAGHYPRADPADHTLHRRPARRGVVVEVVGAMVAEISSPPSDVTDGAY